MEKTVKVRWIKSISGRPERQRKTIRALGFKRLNQVVSLPDQPAVRGMIQSVIHLVEVVE